MEPTGEDNNGWNDKLLSSDWNPIRDAYEDESYNAYHHGPGAHLDPNLQPAVLAKLPKNSITNSRNARYPYLVFLKYPKLFNADSARNLCQRFGKVIRTNENKNKIFVDFQTVGDMDAAFQALQKIDLDLKVQIGNNTILKKSQIDMPSAFGSKTNETRMPEFNYMKKNSGDKSHDLLKPTLEKQSILHLIDFPQRPLITEEIIVSADDYNGENLLKANDPLKHFLIESDSHDLERWALRNKCHQEDESTTKSCKFKTGRCFISLPEKLKKSIMNQHQASKGFYDPETDTYQTLDEGGGFSLCENCDKIGNDEAEESSGPSEDCMKYMPSSNEEVLITSVINTNLVFLVSNKSAVSEKYYKTIIDVAIKGKKTEVLREPPVLGQIVMTHFEGEICRAIVLNNKDLKRIKICYIDYGNIDEKSIEELHKSPENVARMTRCVIPVLLTNVPNYYMTDEMRKFLYYYLRNKPLKIKYDKNTDFIVEKNIYQVELFDETLKSCINNSLNRIFRSDEDSDKSIVDMDIVDALPELDLPLGNNVKLVVMDNSTIASQMITCTTKQYALEIQKFQKDLELYANSSNIERYCPGHSEYCLARYEVDKKWYRGRGIEKFGDGYPTIMFLDYGNIARISIKDIRPYPPEFMVPIFTGDFQIEGLPKDIDDDLAGKLQKLLPIGAEIEFDCVKIDKGGFYVISYSKVLDALEAAENSQ